MSVRNPQLPTNGLRSIATRIARTTARTLRLRGPLCRWRCRRKQTRLAAVEARPAAGRFGCEAEYCFMQSGEIVKRGA
jgi:hypothetical protein